MERRDVLIIDGDHEAAVRLGGELETEGFRVQHASTLRAAKQLLTRERWAARPRDHVVTSLLLPDGSAFELLPLVSRLVPRPWSVTVLADASDIDADRAAELWRAHVALLPKPVRVDHLLLVFAAERVGSPTSERTIEAFAKHYRFTPREKAVFESWFAELERKQSAAALDLAGSTVGTYWRRMAARTRCDGATAVIRHYVRWVLGLELLRPPSPASEPGRRVPHDAG